tara:strand:+ start:388 stop:810 length:423 start_codon:yes stop_codon:yes gene_type:complete
MDNQYRIYLDKEENKKKKIYISVENLKEHTKYEIHINEISPLWLLNMKYFHHDFDNFYRILDLAFVNNSKEIQWKIMKEEEEKISLNINYNPGLEIFGFNITFDIFREEDRVERLIKKVEKLEKENQYILSLLKDKDISN